MLIRLAKIEDLEKMTVIYNQAISTQYATGDTEPVDYKKQLAWFQTHFPHKNPIFVAEMDGKVIGYNYLSDYRGGRLAFRFTMETSYYIEQHYQRKGVASKLMEQVIAFCQQNGIKNLIAFVMEHNKPSIKFLQKQGFQQWGLLPRIADFDSIEYNHTIYGKRIEGF